MSNKPTVLIWLQQTKDNDLARQIRDKLAAQAGVVDVVTGVGNPRLALVTYDTQHTTSQQLLRTAREQDQHALLVAM